MISHFCFLNLNWHNLSRTTPRYSLEHRASHILAAKHYIAINNSDRNRKTQRQQAQTPLPRLYPLSLNQSLFTFTTALPNLTTTTSSTPPVRHFAMAPPQQQPSSGFQPNKTLTFATPLPQSPRSDILEWSLPKPFSHYVLTGKSRAAWHTSFVIPQLNLLLDAGLVVNNTRPKHIFITHGHNDHALLSPVFIKREDPPDFHCPVGMKQVLQDYLRANTMLNLGGLIAPRPGKEVPLEERDPETGEVVRSEIRPTHVTYGLEAGDVVPLRRTKNISAVAFDCDHTVPCLGYLFQQTTHKLRPEFAKLPPKELKAIRASGQELTAPVTTPIFAFLGDTTTKTLEEEPMRGWLEGKDGGVPLPVVITECSFLYEEHRAQAEKTKHTIWGDLEKVVRRYPGTTFVVMHFSLRYSVGEVRRFFKERAEGLDNVVVWVDGEGEDGDDVCGEGEVGDED